MCLQGGGWISLIVECACKVEGESVCQSRAFPSWKSDQPVSRMCLQGRKVGQSVRRVCLQGRSMSIVSISQDGSRVSLSVVCFCKSEGVLVS